MKLWEPQPNESSVAYQAFAMYRDFGPERSIDSVSRKLSKSIPLLKRWSSKWAWVERAMAFDTYLDSVRLAAREQTAAKEARKIMSADEVLQGLTRIADADIADVFEADGSFDLVGAKARGTSKLIKSLKFDKDTGQVVTVELHNAHGGFQDMGKHHKLFTDKVEHSGEVAVVADPAERAARASELLNRGRLRLVEKAG